jgi:hypothetical protein
MSIDELTKRYVMALRRLPKVDPHPDPRVIRLRDTCPRAYAKWSDFEDLLLKDLVRDNLGLDQICTLLERQEGSIRSRIAKLGLAHQQPPSREGAEAPSSDPPNDEGSPRTTRPPMGPDGMGSEAPDLSTTRQPI